MSDDTDLGAASHWNDNTRHDGMRVTKGLSGVWLVLPPAHDHRLPITCCPHCGVPLTSDEDAKHVADTIYPALPYGARPC